MNEEEKESIEEFRKQLRLAINIDDVTTAIRNDNAQTILNLIDKLQKENEELKEDRKNNNEMIALAQNEMLGYIQGYEDGKKLRKNAVANIVENQQYYILNKQIEKYKECIEKLQKENEELKFENSKMRNIELASKNGMVKITLAGILDMEEKIKNSITVQKVKDKIEKEIKYHEKNILDIENITMLKGKTAKEEAEIEFNKYTIVVLKKMLQELLEGRK